jgi:molybdopterin/thiamine biosynthesis adenylyltransferase/rhodanese-related sulfurtransferase
MTRASSSPRPNLRPNLRAPATPALPPATPRDPAAPLPDLGREELARYGRHLTLPEVGLEGQKKLKAASVLLVGAGGLGAPLGLYLAAAGVGRIGLVDFDTVDHSNLHRQVLFAAGDVGQSKLAAARRRLLDVNPFIQIDTHEVRLTSQNALPILADYDIVADGTDNFPTRYLVNDACVLLGKPNAYGSIFRFEGQASVFWAKQGPCYRCLYPEPPPPGLVPSCAEGGVLGILPGIIGTIQAAEVIKLILRTGDTLVGRLLLLDALTMRFRELKLRKDPECPLCGAHPTIRTLIDYEQFCGSPIGQETSELPEQVIEPALLKDLLDRRAPVLLLDVRNPDEWSICSLPGATLIPLPQLPARLQELDPQAEIVVYCKLGGRSADAAGFLRQSGFGRVRNLRGGIDAWAREVDSSLPRY